VHDTAHLGLKPRERLTAGLRAGDHQSAGFAGPYAYAKEARREEPAPIARAPTAVTIDLATGLTVICPGDTIIVRLPASTEPEQP
jgi:hypothetical protein